MLNSVPEINYTQPVVKKLIKATGATDYNILQNNGTIAHQQVHHVSGPVNAISAYINRCKGSFSYGTLKSTGFNGTRC